MRLTPQGLLDGTARLAYEVGESKADGGESRISGTSLDDMRNNVAGIEFAYRTIFAHARRAASAARRCSRAATGQRGAGGRVAGRLGQVGIASADTGGAIAMNIR